MNWNGISASMLGVLLSAVMLLEALPLEIRGLAYPAEPQLPAARAPASQPGLPASLQGQLTLPDLQALPPFELSIEVLAGGDLKRLRLAVSVVNRGPGPLELEGVSDFQSLTTIVMQRLETAGDSSLELPVGSFIFHPAHDHWHLENFARYEVWTLTRGGGLKDLLAQNSKVSFCLRDLAPGDPPEVSVPAAYTNCGREVQGLSPGWIDTYRSHLAGQHVDITGVPDGIYAVRVTFDPEDLLLEAFEENNSALEYVEISGSEVRLLDDWGKLKILLDPRLE